ncbi:YebY family protein [Acerihabitans sp. KWT182]|uniref:YebY family protein n=1 Tax=Acerihabitans sp. KWT182 TaxID=3157919 RepID=A0AAU7Q5R1_9GAMM
MKIRFLILPIALIAQAAGAAQIVTVSKFQYGKQWAFQQEELQLLCRADQSLFALNMSTLMQYPLNDKAKSEMLSGQVKAVPVETILLDDPAKPGQKMSIAPFAARARQLCNQPG